MKKGKKVAGKVRCLGRTNKGTQCLINVKPGTSYCKRHTPGYVSESTQTKIITMQNAQAALDRLAEKTKDREKYGICKFRDEYNIEGEQLDEYVVATWIDTYVKKAIAKIIARDRDNYPLPIYESPSDEGLSDVGKEIASNEGREMLPFARRHWQKVGWLLDFESYCNLALTCKTLYRVLCLDKVWAYFHPLICQNHIFFENPVIMHPKMIKMPLYRIVQFEIPDDADDYLKEKNLPTLTQLIDFDPDAFKKLNVKQYMQKCGDIQQELMQKLITEFLDKDQVYEESIKGAGIFDDVVGEVKVGSHNYEKIPNCVYLDFIEKPPEVRLISTEKATWLLAKSSSLAATRIIHKQLKAKLVGYDGKRIIRLMKVN